MIWNGKISTLCTTTIKENNNKIFNKPNLLKLLSLSLPLPLHFSIKVMYFFCVFFFVVEKLQGNYYTNNCYNIKYSYVRMYVCMLELKLQYFFFVLIFLCRMPSRIHIQIKVTCVVWPTAINCRLSLLCCFYAVGQTSGITYAN